MRRVDSLEKTLMLGGIGGRRRRGQPRMRGWMASLTQRTWIWVKSESWWWTGRPGVLLFMGSQRVGHDWVTEMNSIEREDHCQNSSAPSTESSPACQRTQHAWFESAWKTRENHQSPLTVLCSFYFTSDSLQLSVPPLKQSSSFNLIQWKSGWHHNLSQTHVG